MKEVFYSWSALWKFVVFYQLTILLLVAIFDLHYLVDINFIIPRAFLLLSPVLAHFYSNQFSLKYRMLIDSLIIYVSLSYFYGETAHLNTFLFVKMDPLLSEFEQALFGFQPSLAFSVQFSSIFFSELMFMGYFSYYLMPLIALLVIWIKRNHFFEYFSYQVLSAYFFYYLVFILLPAEGPQYYFQEPLNQIESSGFFANIVKLIQKFGEAPTAAFPSSHVGITIIILILLFKKYRSLFFIFLPFSVLLFFATIYIKAHYAVDVIAGVISAPIVLLTNKYIFSYFNFNANKKLYAHRN